MFTTSYHGHTRHTNTTCGTFVFFVYLKTVILQEARRFQTKALSTTVCTILHACTTHTLFFFFSSQKLGAAGVCALGTTRHYVRPRTRAPHTRSFSLFLAETWHIVFGISGYDSMYGYTRTFFLIVSRRNLVLQEYAVYVRTGYGSMYGPIRVNHTSTA